MFALISTCWLLASLAGCDERDTRTAFQIMPSTDRVTLGPLDDYRDLGVYETHAKKHGVFLVTTRPGPGMGEKMLFALRHTCPHDGQRLHYDAMTNRFDCPRGDHHFTVEGLPTTPGYEGPAMVRVAVLNKQGDLVIAPDRLFYFQKQQWSLEHSMLLLGD
ncbi:MAG: hypothetical protein ACOC3G_04315 [Phycisphaeraceae bacterium]